MSQIAEQKCPACGAPLRFDPASGKLVCDYCGTTVDLQADAAASTQNAGTKPAGQAPQGSAAKPASASAHGAGEMPASAASNSAHNQARKKKIKAAKGKEQAAEASAAASHSAHNQVQVDHVQNADTQTRPAEAPGDILEGFDFANMTDMVTDPNAMDLPIYNCVSCGAEVIAPPEQMALTCPYCGNNIVLTEKVSGKLRPDGVIPFRIQAKDLPDAVNRFYKDKKLLPRRFFSQSTMGKVTGVYVPFWVFTGEVDGTLEYRAQTSSSSRSGDYIITQTNHYRLIRQAAVGFDKLPVDASGKVEDRLMDSLEPFDQNLARPFDMRYLAGFTADRFDQKKEDIAERARRRMRNSTFALVDAQASAGYGSVSREKSDLRTSLDAKYILFPVYLFDISHAGKSYHFAVNGQTGKVVGDIPTDGNVSMLYFLKRFGIVSGALILYSVAKYMLGM